MFVGLTAAVVGGPIIHLALAHGLLQGARMIPMLIRPITSVSFRWSVQAMPTLLIATVFLHAKPMGLITTLVTLALRFVS